MEDGDLFFDVNSLINKVFDPVGGEKLRDIFEKRVIELDMSPTQALDVIGISYRSLNTILDGSKTSVDYLNILKIADFLAIDRQKAISIFVKSLEEKHLVNLNVSPKVVEFIKANFDLAALRKANFISSITDFVEIEAKLKELYGIKTIFEYQRPKMEVAFSAGLVAPKSENVRGNWIEVARTLFEDINNPNPYNRKALIDYFPKIRWHSMNVESGLTNVIRDLYNVGVTIIYQDSLPGLKLRGATFSVDGKPCIVLTNHVGFYPTLWFALIHELFHVLFDWLEISEGGYHLSDEDSDILTVQEKEEEANNFAREYLFSKEKTNNVAPLLNKPEAVEHFAKLNQVHLSFVYLFCAIDSEHSGGHTWAKVHKHNPDFSILINKIGNPWENRIANEKFIKYLKSNIYA